MPARAYPDPKAIFEVGDEIYKKKYQADFEAKYEGKFAAINIKTGEAIVADGDYQALTKAEESDPTALFHFVRIGRPALYSVSSCYNLG